jgi:hypothetical protein
MSDSRKKGDDRPEVRLTDLEELFSFLLMLLPLFLEFRKSFRFIIDGPPGLVEARKRFEAQQEEIRTIENEAEGDTPSRPTIKAEGNTPSKKRKGKAKGSTPKASPEATCGTNSRTGEPVKGKSCGMAFTRKVDADGNPIGGYRCGTCSPKSGNGLPSNEPERKAKKSKRKGKGKSKKGKRNKAAEAASAADETTSGHTPRGNRGGSTETECRVCGKRFIGTEEDVNCEGQQGLCARLSKNARDRLYKRVKKGELPKDAHKDWQRIRMEIATWHTTPDHIRAHLMATG